MKAQLSELKSEIGEGFKCKNWHTSKVCPSNVNLCHGCAKKVHTKNKCNTPKEKRWLKMKKAAIDALGSST